jgi:hypothetical protein
MINFRGAKFCTKQLRYFWEELKKLCVAHQGEYKTKFQLLSYLRICSVFYCEDIKLGKVEKKMYQTVT